MKKMLAVAALLVVAGAALARRPAEVARPVRVATPTTVTAPAPVPPERSSDPVRRTAETLGIREVEAFTVAAQDAVAMLHRAQVRRQQELSVPSPEVQVSIDSDLALESDRRAALDRLEPFLDQSERHREFRQQVDTWAATVWTRSQGGSHGPDHR